MRGADAGAAAARCWRPSTRRFYRIRTLEDFAEQTLDGHAFLTARYRHEGRRRHAGDRLRRARRPAGRGCARSPPGRPRSARGRPSRSPTSTREHDGRARARDELAAAAARRARGRAAAGRRAPHRRGRRASRGGAAACRRSRRSRSARARRPGRAGGPARPAPDDVRTACVCRGSSEFSLERLPSAEDVYLFHGVARANPKDERLFALAEVRDLTPVRDEDGTRQRAARARAHARRGARGHPPLPGPPQAEPAAAVEPRPAARLADDRPRARGDPVAGRPARRRATAGSASRWCSSRAALREAGGSASACCASSRPAGRRRRRRGRRPADAAAAAARRGRAADRRGAPARPAAPGRDRQAAGARATATTARAASRPASSSSTTSTTAARLVPVDRPPAHNPAGVVVGLIRNFTERHPEGMLRVIAARRPDAGARLAGRARVPADHRGARPGRGAAACRSSGSRCRPGRRSPWTAAPRTWTGSPPCCGGSSSSRRPAARSTSWSPASTSAPSRTGTPRRRCSCTRGASS